MGLAYTGSDNIRPQAHEADSAPHACCMEEVRALHVVLTQAEEGSLLLFAAPPPPLLLSTQAKIRLHLACFQIGAQACTPADTRG